MPSRSYVACTAGLLKNAICTALSGVSSAESSSLTRSVTAAPADVPWFQLTPTDVRVDRERCTSSKPAPRGTLTQAAAATSSGAALAALIAGPPLRRRLEPASSRTSGNLGVLEQVVLAGELPVQPRGSPYTRTGDLLVVACSLLLDAMGLWRSEGTAVAGA